MLITWGNWLFCGECLEFGPSRALASLHRVVTSAVQAVLVWSPGERQGMVFRGVSENHSYALSPPWVHPYEFPANLRPEVAQQITEKVVHGPGQCGWGHAWDYRIPTAARL
jgi:hypothetical protein